LLIDFLRLPLQLLKQKNNETLFISGSNILLFNYRIIAISQQNEFPNGSAQQFREIRGKYYFDVLGL
jgi:hypothetical protein